SLGIKQLTPDPFEGEAASGKLKKGVRVTCEVTAVKDNGIEAKLIDQDLTTFIRRSDLSRDRSEQRPDRFGVGEKFDAVVTQVDPKTRKLTASIKALEIAEEKEAVAQYGSTDSGASLGDILGAALNKASGDVEEEPAEKPKPKRKTAAKAKADDEAAEAEASSEEEPAEKPKRKRAAKAKTDDEAADAKASSEE
ncbi:MAG: S1 RNA-binding domain-containing protein, partial [Alphaproteobacteria bacterium]